MFLCNNMYMQKTYFLFDDTNKLRDDIELLQKPSHLAYGAYHLENQSLCIWDNLSIMRCFTLQRHSQVVIINPKWAILLKMLGHKVVLINLNSNHIIERNKHKLALIKKIYNSCDIIVCLDKIQLQKLKQLQLTSKLVVNPLGIDSTLIDTAQNVILNGIIKYDEFYLSAGFDNGAKFNFDDILCKTPIVYITTCNPLPYNKYVYTLSKCKALVLRRVNTKQSSDLTGNTTVLEALVAHRPVIINSQPWIEHLKEPNIHVYKNNKELEYLLTCKNILWVETKKDYTIEKYLIKLKKILKLPNL